jgi:hypothetical protein
MLLQAWGISLEAIGRWDGLLTELILLWYYKHLHSSRGIHWYSEEIDGG